MEPRLKRKIIWFDDWNIREQETWLSDMALEGWTLIKIGRVFATFEESETQEVTYRCGMLFADDQITQQKIELYRESGWEYIGSRKYISVFREIKNQQVREIYLNPVERTKTISSLQENIKKKGILAIISALLLILLNVWALQINPVQIFLTDSSILSIYTIIVSILIVIHMINGMIHIRKLANQFMLDETDQFSINYGRIIFRKKLLKVCEIMIAISLIVMIVKMIAIDQKHDEGVFQDDLPVLQLSDIVEGIDDEQLTASNYADDYYVSSSILVPKQYELYQSISEDDHGGENLSISSELYDGRNEWIAEKLIHALVKRYSEYQPGYQLISHDYFDALWIAKGHLNITFIVRKETTVYYLRYDDSSLSDNREMDILLKIEENL